MAKLLTPEQAARAIYFDFEGCVGEAPSLLGWSFIREDGTERFGQGIVARALWGATRAVPQIGYKLRCTQSTLSTEVDCLVTLAEEGDRAIVSWAHHDMDMIARYVDDLELVERAPALHERVADCQTMAEEGSSTTPLQEDMERDAQTLPLP